MKRTIFIAFTIVIIVYLIAGALVFHFIEGGKERKVKESFAATHKAFLESHTCLTPEALREYVLVVLDSQERGVDVEEVISRNGTNGSDVMDSQLDDTSWDMASAFLFCLTVITTIGYGNIAPKTKGGKVFCIFYALCGIPLFATTLVGVGERLQIPLTNIKKGKAWLRSDASKDAQLKTCVFCFTGILVLIFIPSAVIASTEDWSFIESLYFCVITLTTVGFGDYVPGYFNRSIRHGQNTSKHLTYLYRVVLAVWIMVGLSWIALILSEVASVLQNKIIKAARTTQSRLGDLEDMVKKKARETRERITQKASSRRPAASHKDKDRTPTPADGQPRKGSGDESNPNPSGGRPGYKLEETALTGGYQQLTPKSTTPGPDGGQGQGHGETDSSQLSLHVPSASPSRGGWDGRHVV